MQPHKRRKVPAVIGNGRDSKNVIFGELQEHFTTEVTRFANFPPDRFILCLALQIAEKMTVFSDWPRDLS